ncbi:peptidoglycan DD-metalloendopeptidase family protein [Yunchengibacter salinarum]|uniref:peptidoglycan DD-metalloendopeptidase family protein n=1 Tax=Yunchengibacter salinarum TaxID=3133399 RepID=UPI0035B59EA0
MRAPVQMVGAGHPKPGRPKRPSALPGGLLALAAALMLAACGGGPINPADIQPVHQVRNSPIPVPFPKWKPSRSRAQASARASSGGAIKVEKGDTLYGLSRQYGVSLQRLIRANDLSPPYTLMVGDRLSLPTAKVHVVKKGETGYSISRRYDVTVSELMQENGIGPPYTLEIGQKLRLPGGARSQVADSGSAARSKSSATSRRTAQRTQKKSTPKPPPRTGSRFAWPVKGAVASRYGPKKGGRHNDGINILADRGAPVRAAEAGVVVYASDALKGYGNLLLIKHSGGWITAYAHNERLLVREGQTVKKGEPVARVGDTGGVSRPQLHFEIRKGRQALDPLRHLGRQTAQR